MARKLYVGSIEENTGLTPKGKKIYIESDGETYENNELKGKKIYVCDNINAIDVKYSYNTECGIEVNNVQEALDAMCEKLYEIKDKHMTVTFKKPRLVWEIEHNLNKMVSVTLEDLNGNDIEGDVEYYNDNIVLIYFSQPMSGYAYIN